MTGTGTGRGRRRFSPEQIRDYLALFARRGVSAAAFAREHRLCYSAFLRWRQRPGRGPQRAPLQEVALGSLLGGSRWTAEVVRPDGLTLRVAREVSVPWLAQVLRAC